MTNLRAPPPRKPSAIREKELRLAVKRIQLGRSARKPEKLTFAAVAREAGVSAALIHNHYPQIAELIRTSQGHSSRTQRDAKRRELKVEREKTRALREENAALNQKVRLLASINATLLAENARHRARLSDSKVVDLASRRAPNR